MQAFGATIDKADLAAQRSSQLAALCFSVRAAQSEAVVTTQCAPVGTTFHSAQCAAFWVALVAAF